MRKPGSNRGFLGCCYQELVVERWLVANFQITLTRPSLVLISLIYQWVIYEF